MSNVEIKVTGPQTVNYSAITDDAVDDGECSSHDGHLDTELVLDFLHHLQRKAHANQFVSDDVSVPSTDIMHNIACLCSAFIGDETQIMLEKELNPDFVLLGYDNQLHIDDKIGCFYGCKDSQHLKSSILTICMLVVLFWGFTCEVSSFSVNTCDISFWYDYYWLIILFLLYIFYFIEFVMSSTTYYLYNMFDGNGFEQYIKEMMLLSPRLWLEFESEEPKQITKSKHFVYSKWSDQSDNMKQLYLTNNNHTLIKLKIDRFIVFADGETARRCDKDMDDYITNEVKTNGSYFDHVHKHWAINDDNHKKRVLLHIGAKSFTLSFPFYILTSCLLCSMCFRIWFSSKTAKRRYKIVKQISL
eukprot:210855_1